MAFSVATYMLRKEREERRERQEMRERQERIEMREREKEAYEKRGSTNTRVQVLGEWNRSTVGEDEMRDVVGETSSEAEGSSSCTVEVLQAEDDDSGSESEGSSSSASGQVAECRICQMEDSVTNLDSPCKCRGSLQYVHQKCLQKWCCEKGDTICEICKSPLRGNYVVSERHASREGPYSTAFVGWLIPGFSNESRDESESSRHRLCSRSFLRLYFMILMGIAFVHVLIFVSKEDAPPVAYLISFVLRVLILFIPFLIVLRIILHTWRYYHNIREEREPTIFLYNSYNANRPSLVSV